MNGFIFFNFIGAWCSIFFFIKLVVIHSLTMLRTTLVLTKGCTLFLRIWLILNKSAVLVESDLLKDMLFGYLCI